MNADSQPSSSPETVNRLVVLPFQKALEIAFKSIQVRFFRSLITTLSLILAVAFLSFVRVGTDVADGLLNADQPQFRQMLIQAGYDIGPEDTSVASTAKQRWIVILSLLVCVVGIVNAQLMAVTERFREIGTMKCLGALDRFVLRLFVMEAGMQGVAGGTVGALAGALFALINATLSYGWPALSQVSWPGVVLSIIISTGVGFLLSLLGVLYPASLAARMQPVEAMRVEQ